MISEMTSPLQLPKSSPSQELCPPHRPLLCCREAGEKETEGARGIVHRALFIGIPSGSLCGGDSRGRTGAATPSGLIFFTLFLLRDAPSPA